MSNANDYMETIRSMHQLTMAPIDANMATLCYVNTIIANVDIMLWNYIVKNRFALDCCHNYRYASAYLQPFSIDVVSIITKVEIERISVACAFVDTHMGERFINQSYN